MTIVADYQEHGSGRKGRSWIASPGSALLCTIALPDAIPTTDLWIVPYWTALIVAAAMREYGASPVLQWPNDVLIGRRKVSGILCVSRVIGDYAWVGCGIGVNVTRPPGDAELASITPPPAFLSDVIDVHSTTLLHAILRQADLRYDDLSTPGRIAHEWEKAAGLPGARYRILIDGESEPFEATTLRLLNGGALLVDHDGEQREIALADARVLRE